MVVGGKERGKRRVKRWNAKRTECIAVGTAIFHLSRGATIRLDLVVSSFVLIMIWSQLSWHDVSEQLRTMCMAGSW